MQRLEKDNEALQGFLIGRGPKIRENTQGKKQKISEIEQLAVSNSTGSIDWNSEAELTKSHVMIRKMIISLMYTSLIVMTIKLIYMTIRLIYMWMGRVKCGVLVALM